MQKGSEIKKNAKNANISREKNKNATPHIKIENLGIRFNLRKNNKLKDFLLGHNKKDSFYAIRHIDLEMKSGEVIGLFGKNGSGKTTLLRTIAGIYSPDEGNISVQGKLSFFNIRPGFNNDLDGISNIYLAMSLYGVDKKTTDRKIKEIIRFADIGEFINEQVRTYSTGMTARLGFAIGINVDADIILIDETLSVGDKEFRKKCEEKIEELMKKKNKIIIISGHDEEHILKYCNRTIKLT